MKLHRSLFSMALVGTSAILLASSDRSPAQLFPDSPKSVSTVAMVAEAKGLPLVSREDLPWFGTYWVVRNSVVLVGGQGAIDQRAVVSIVAPAPCPPRDEGWPIYAVGSGHFLVDQSDGPLVVLGNRQATSADYAVIIQTQMEDLLHHVAWIQEAELRADLSALDGEGPPLPPGGGGGEGGGSGGSTPPPLYTLRANLCLYPPIVTSTSITLLLTNAPDSGLAYQCL